MLSTTYKIAASLVTAAWLAAMGTLVYLDHSAPTRTGAPDPEALGSVTGMAPTGDELMGAYIEGTRIGWTKTSSRRRAGGWVLGQEGELNITVQGQPRKIQTEGMANVDGDYRLQSFTFRLTTEGSDITALGRVVGRELVVAVKLGGGEREIRLPLRKDVFIDLNVDRYLAAKGLKPGDRFEIEVFDPQTLSNIPVKVEVVGMERMSVMGFDVYATHLRRTVGGARFDAWIDMNGKSLKEQGPLGITLVRESAADIARKRSRPSRDLIAAASISPSRAIPEPESRRMLRLRLKGPELGIYDLASWRQTLEGDTLTVLRDDLVALPAAALPAGDPALKDFLKASPLIESDNESIRAAAREAIGGETGLVAAALKLNDWLFANLKKKNVIGVPDALNTLKTMEGDCNEHTFLYVAMARSAGIPARVAAGIAYLGGRFYYHAWPEVWAGGWVALDPTWGQAPADVTHVRFIADDLGRLSDIIGLVGNLSIEVVEWE